MIVWYLAFLILGIVIVSCDKRRFWDDFWENFLLGFLIWVMCFISFGIFIGGLVSSTAEQEIVETQTYELCDFSEHYVDYDEDTYLVIKEDGDLALRYLVDNEEVEEAFSNFKIDYKDEKDVTPTLTMTLKDTKDKTLKHLFWNYNVYEKTITVPKMPN